MCLKYKSSYILSKCILHPWILVLPAAEIDTTSTEALINDVVEEPPGSDTMLQDGLEPAEEPAELMDGPSPVIEVIQSQQEQEDDHDNSGAYTYILNWHKYSWK